MVVNTEQGPPRLLRLLALELVARKEEGMTDETGKRRRWVRRWAPIVTAIASIIRILIELLK